MAAQFKAAGHQLLESPEDADLVIVNSCTVTTAAASDSRQKVRQANKAGAKQIVVTGCLATMEPVEIGFLPGVTRVVPNLEKKELPGLILGNKGLENPLPARKPIPGLHRRTRAFIKIQDGCDNFCTFCVTRIARGKSVSLLKDEVLAMVLAAQAGGSKEVVLTGVNLGAWGRDPQGEGTLRDLIQYLLENSEMERFRLSSLEPWDLDEEFFSLWKDSRLCHHLHLPLQSGSKGVLKRMARNTTPEKFSALVRHAREQIPGVSITTDIIVGFPGETEDEFKESLAFVERMRFSGGHVFHYSRRQGTPAARLGEVVPGNVAVERSRSMRAIVDRSAQAYASSQVGKSVNVLWERCLQKSSSKWQLEGFSDAYIKVRSESIIDRYNEIDTVKIVSAEKSRLAGVLISEQGFIP